MSYHFDRVAGCCVAPLSVLKYLGCSNETLSHWQYSGMYVCMYRHIQMCVFVCVCGRLMGNTVRV